MEEIHDIHEHFKKKLEEIIFISIVNFIEESILRQKCGLKCFTPEEIELFIHNFVEERFKP